MEPVDILCHEKFKTLYDNRSGRRIKGDQKLIAEILNLYSSPWAYCTICKEAKITVDHVNSHLIERKQNTFTEV